MVALELVMLIAIWHMARDGTLYDDPGGDFYTRRRPERAKQRAIRQLTTMDTTSLDAAG